MWGGHQQLSGGQGQAGRSLHAGQGQAMGMDLPHAVSSLEASHDSLLVLENIKR